MCTRMMQMHVWFDWESWPLCLLAFQFCLFVWTMVSVTQKLALFHIKTIYDQMQVLVKSYVSITELSQKIGITIHYLINTQHCTDTAKNRQTVPSFDLYLDNFMSSTTKFPPTFIVSRIKLLGWEALVVDWIGHSSLRLQAYLTIFYNFFTTIVLVKCRILRIPDLLFSFPLPEDTMWISTSILWCTPLKRITSMGKVH